jgi:saccharopine dehydrogenase (NAD+, L-lysine-forming)
MGDPTILILGGTGMAGLPIARLLLEHTAVRLILAARRLERAVEAVSTLNRVFPGLRVSARRADAADAASLAEAFRGVDWVIDCTPSTAYVDAVTETALSAGADYFDILFGPKKIQTLLGKEARISEAGRCFITEGGYHPGLPSALVRYGARRLERIDTASVAGLLNIVLPYTDAVEELVRTFEQFTAHEYRDGQWRKATGLWYRRFDFGPPWGVRGCVPMDLEEMKSLPEMLGLKEAAFYISGSGWLGDLLLMPWYLLPLGRARWGAKLGAKLLVWGSRVAIRPPNAVILKLEATGQAGGKLARLEVSVRHTDGYLFTAIPVVATVLQVLDGSIRKPGLWMMGQVAQPARLMRDMQRMGVEVSERLTLL